MLGDTGPGLFEPAIHALTVSSQGDPRLAANHGFEGAIALPSDEFANEDLTGDGMNTAFGQSRHGALANWLPQTVGRPLFEGMRSVLSASPNRAAPTGLVAAFTVVVPALVRQAKARCRRPRR